MWPLKKNHEKHVSIICSQDQLALCALEKAPRDATPYLFHITAYNSIPIMHGEYDQGRVYNPTALAKHITHFLKTTHNKKTPIAFTLSGDYIKENIIASHTASLAEHITKPSKQYALESCYLYTQSEGTFAFYTCAIERPIIMQYQLMAILNKFNLQSIITPSIAHLNLCRYLKGSSFSHSALANLLRDESNTIPSLMDMHAIEKIIYINPSVRLSNDQKAQLPTALGASILL